MEEQQLQTCLPLIICTNKIQKQKLPGGCNLHLILSFVTCTMSTITIFIPALRALLIPNTTANHTVTD